MICRNDLRAESLRATGVETVIGDLLDIDSIRAALQNIRAAYFVYPKMPGLIDATALFAQATKEAGISAIANTSPMTSRRDSNSHATHGSLVSECAFDRSARQFPQSEELDARRINVSIANLNTSRVAMPSYPVPWSSSSPKRGREMRGR